MFIITPILVLAASLAIGAPLEATTGTTDMTGRGTVYDQFGGFGSCGQQHADSDYIVAISADYMPGSCGKRVSIKDQDTGKTVVAAVRDTCPGCSANDIDLSRGAWNDVTNNAADGVFPAEWSFV